MADDPKDPKDDPAKGDPPKKEPSDPAMDTEGGKKALDAERKRARDEKKRADDAEARLKELEDKDKSELEKLRDEVTDLKSKLTDSDTKSLRAEVAVAKGLSAAQAKRLVGATKEELETDADEILEAFPVAGGAKPPPSDKPKPNLRGGGDPNEGPTETDPAKLADSVPRL